MLYLGVETPTAARVSLHQRAVHHVFGINPLIDPGCTPFSAPDRVQYATILGIPYIYGATPESERSRILGTFRVNPLVNCIGLSKVGDTSIDIPEANVIIQASGRENSLASIDIEGILHHDLVNHAPACYDH